MNTPNEAEPPCAQEDRGTKIDLSLLPLSGARRVGDFVFVSGQLPITPDGVIVREDIQAQTRLVIRNVERLLLAHGARLQDVVKVTAWLSDKGLSAGFNGAYAEFFQAPFPARSTVVAELLVPADVEMEVMAFSPA